VTYDLIFQTSFFLITVKSKILPVIRVKSVYCSGSTDLSTDLLDSQAFSLKLIAEQDRQTQLTNQAKERATAEKK
jgi:hypothetical protein